MSRFGFNFGRDNNKNKRRERDDIVLRHEPASEYDSDYDNDETEEEDNSYYNSHAPRDPRLMTRPYRTDDAYSHRNTRQRPPELENDALGFRRQNPNSSRDDMMDDYQQRANFGSPGQRPLAGYEQQRQNAGYNRQSQRDDLKGLGFWNNDDSDTNYDDSEADADRPSALKFIVVVTGLVFICTVTWLAYRWISLPTSDTPPLIQAETNPYRVRPENPGGTDFPHQDKLIYGRLAPATEQPVERLLPPPEQAVIMAPTYVQPQGQYPQQPAQNYPQQQGQVAGQQIPAQPQAYAAPVYVPANQPGQQPNQVQEQAQYSAQPAQQQAPAYSQQQYQEQQYAGQAYVQPNQQQLNQQTANHWQSANSNGLPQNQPQQYQQQMAQNPATLMEQPVIAEKPSTVDTLNSIVNGPEEKVTPADTTLYYLQLGTLTSEPLAKKEKERLQKRYANELTGMALSIKSFIASDKQKKYRIIAGPQIVSLKVALDKCAKLGKVCSPVKS